MLTALPGEESEAGQGPCEPAPDDYIVKPFSVAGTAGGG